MKATLKRWRQDMDGQINSCKPLYEFSNCCETMREPRHDLDPGLKPSPACLDLTPALALALTLNPSLALSPSLVLTLPHLLLSGIYGLAVRDVGGVAFLGRLLGGSLARGSPRLRDCRQHDSFRMIGWACN